VGDGRSAGWPGWGGILRGFNPVSILKDGFADAGDLKLSNWSSLASRSAWNDARFFVGDPEIHAAIQGLVDDLASVGKAPAQIPVRPADWVMPSDSSSPANSAEV
jgi:hypothetical protein